MDEERHRRTLEDALVGERDREPDVPGAARRPCGQIERPAKRPRDQVAGRAAVERAAIGRPAPVEGHGHRVGRSRSQRRRERRAREPVGVLDRVGLVAVGLVADELRLRRRDQGCDAVGSAKLDAAAPNEDRPGDPVRLALVRIACRQGDGHALPGRADRRRDRSPRAGR